jgi:hypothetical protein
MMAFPLARLSDRNFSKLRSGTLALHLNSISTEFFLWIGFTTSTPVPPDTLRFRVDNVDNYSNQSHHSCTG